MNVNFDTRIKNRESCGTKCNYCDCFLRYANFKDDLIEYKCSSCNKNYQQQFYKKLKEQFFNTYKFSNHVYFIVAKSVYPYEYMGDLGKFYDASLPEKEDFYSRLNMEDITGTERFCKAFEIKNRRIS